MELPFAVSEIRKMMSVHPATLPVEQLLRDCDIQRLRRGGPGGQHRNKVETAIVLVHRPTGIRSEANERRSQANNRRVAVRRLRVQLALELRSPVNSPATRAPSERWRQRCGNGRIAVSQSHDDYPGLLAEALDAVHAAEYDMSRVAEQKGVSLSQLMRFLKREPTAWERITDARRRRGLRPLW